uniref:Slc8a-2 n=1 Tax=Schmidtea mediterranea TaxID=79327 RepID=A0A0H3YIW4_SCHMD|nr:slc8a-2 [Schmidtea mediterranea]
MTNSLYCKALNNTKCVDGVLLSMWQPAIGISHTDKVIRAMVYFLYMCYLFLGVSIIADRFMAAIEIITSQERKFKIKKKNGETNIVYVKIWNETVSNLTLMALGSSAPEILLSIIEIIGKNFEAGELGPGTIVGSAAFNLFVIIGICVMVIPDNETRKTKHLSVFIVTTIWSLFAYIWLYLILAFISPGVVEVWEAVLTFLFFPLTVISAYLADTKIFFKQFFGTKVLGGFTKTDNSKNMPNLEDIPFLEQKDTNLKNQTELLAEECGSSSESFTLDQFRIEYMHLIKDLRKINSNLNLDDLEAMAEIELFKRRPKSRAYYRLKAMQYLTGTSDPIRKLRSISMINETEIKYIDNLKVQEVTFFPDHYTVFENNKKVILTLKRVGEGISTTVIDVDYYTEDGTAKDGSDYVSKIGTIRFEKGQLSQEIIIDIIDDDIYEEDEYFYVKLKSPRTVKTFEENETALQIKLGSFSSAIVMILDDDYPGNFHFEKPKMKISENVGHIQIKVIRSSGARGQVKIPIKTIAETAINTIHYRMTTDELIFENNQIENHIDVYIYDENEYSKSILFSLELGEPTSEQISIQSDSGRPKLGNISKLEIEVTENPDLKKIIDNLIEKGKIEKVITTSTWREQFHEALTIQKSNESDEMPSCTQYIFHYLSLFWKILFAFVPPADILNGWLCFFVSVFIIGVLTAIIGDVASAFGCHVGLTDSVTAITFVALGTSLPDTFASKCAAINDDTADASIGNVMGSNAVNVFLGIGIAWTLASIYHAVSGKKFLVDSGSLGFSVTLFTILALVAVSIMLLRRIKQIGGELGGPKPFKYITGVFFCFMWLIYLIFSSLEIYCHIKGF